MPGAWHECGQAFVAFSTGPHDPFNDVVSFMVNGESQGELDRYWDAIVENGGKPQALRVDHRQVRRPLADRADGAKLEAAFQGR